MSKKRARKAERPSPVGGRPFVLRKRRAAAALAACVALAGAAVALWAPLRRGSAPPVTPAPAAQQTPLPLAKEYIYAGGRLVATEEPAPAGPPPAGLDAAAAGAVSVSLTWTPPASGTITSYIVERAQSATGPFTRLGPDPTGPAFTDSSVSADAAYLYRVKAVFADGTSSAFGTPDLATTVAFSEPQPAAGVVIRAEHLKELRRAVNAVRTLTGLGAASWTYPDPVSAPASQRRPIYLEDVTELRSKLDEALAALGPVAPYPPDPPLARGAAVKADHFEQIKARVR